jgi:hypothetical protein
LPAFVILFGRDPRAQPHIEFGRRDDRLKATDQFAQGRALGVKLLARPARDHVRHSLRTRPVPEFKFVNFSPRVAAFSIGHDYTT